MIKRNGNQRKSDFKIKIGTKIKDEKRDLIITDRKVEVVHNKDGSFKQNRKWYLYHCNKCNYDEGWIREDRLLGKKQVGCSCCASKIVVENINSIYKTDPWMIPYIGEECAKTHAHSSRDKVEVTCPDCGRVKEIKMEINSIYKRHSIACSCGDGKSYSEKFMTDILKQLNIEFISEYSPEWIGLRRYDFYIPILNIIVEMDGGWHKIDNNKSGQTKEESKAIDDYKDEMAIKHNIEKPIRIDCEISNLKYIRNNILNSRLNKLFDLSKIDWLKAEEFALSNRVKEACDYKRDNPNMTTIEIAKIMNLSSTTISLYFQKGKNLGWYNCNNLLKSSNSVEIFKNNISLGIFKSCRELGRCSEELFGIKLDHRRIGDVCKNIRRQYNGFTFKYIEQNKLQEAV